MISTMEESERTVTSEIGDGTEVKDFSDQLVDFPHIVEYIKNLHNEIKLQRIELVELKTKIADRVSITIKLNLLKILLSGTCIIKDSIYFHLQEKELLNKTFESSETQTGELESPEKMTLQEWTTADNEEKTASIVDQVTEAAESAMLQTGFVYEETTGLYYDYSSGYYYDAVCKINIYNIVHTK